MRHNFFLKGFAFNLRPVELTDAEFIVQMRTADPERARYLHPVSPDVQLQREWLAKYFERDADYYWVVERPDTHSPEGLIGIYGVDPEERTAEWGRWILKPGSLAAIESSLLIYRVAFEFLKLESLYCLTIEENLSVLSFHDSCGLSRTELLKNHFTLGGRQYDAVKHVCLRNAWPDVRRKLEPKAQAIAKRILNQ
jgi:RimJ/RimL family protein N-acetyltransferase